MSLLSPHRHIDDGVESVPNERQRLWQAVLTNAIQAVANRDWCEFDGLATRAGQIVITCWARACKPHKCDRARTAVEARRRVARIRLATIANKARRANT